MSTPSKEFAEIGKHYEAIRATLDPTTQNNFAMCAELLGLSAEETLTLVVSLCGPSADQLKASEIEGGLDLVVGVFLIGLVAGQATRDAEATS
jgi:hypothetical protein